MQDSHAGEETRQARAREKTEKGKHLSVASFSASTPSLSSLANAGLRVFDLIDTVELLLWDTSIQGTQKMFT